MNIYHGGGTQSGGQKESMGQEGGGEDGRGEKDRKANRPAEGGECRK